MMKHYSVIIICLLFCVSGSAQIYTEKQTRHRFAQLTLGVDFQSSIGGKGSYRNTVGEITDVGLERFNTPRFVIGGTHFWGHADFYIAVPVYSKVLSKLDQRITVLSGVETVFKYYPWRIQNNKIRPFVGLSLSPFYYEQKNDLMEFGNGPELNHTSVPVSTGLTFNKGGHLLELGLTWNYNNRQNYYISRQDQADITTPPLYLNVSYKYMLETTISAEKDWESGRTKTTTERLSSENKLNGFYIGAGLSSSFWLGQSDYNVNNRPYIEQYSTSIMLDYTLGYYLSSPDMNIGLAYRKYGTSTNVYGVRQQLKRRSVVFEITKALFDYHGFVPFVGPAVSYDRLGFSESFEGESTIDHMSNQIGYGLTFGWDVRPNELQTWILRTNVRWFPNLSLELDNNSSVSFDNVEFNFIQLIIYPGRLF